MVEKLSKALEGLKNIQFTTSSGDVNTSKEKMFFCVLAADVMVSLKTKNTQNLPIVIENMINLCDDKDSDVRMVAEESLNRIIMSLSQPNMLKVQVELHNIIKKNGPARCLRVALTRFGQLSHYIRPNKGKAHVQMLIPALIEIAKRKEESIHETLASSLENIFKVLGIFVKDNVLKGLIKAFLHNLSSSNPVIRRCSASSIITIVQYCRKPLIFNCFVLNSLLDCVVPVCEENSSDLILGVFGCLRLLLPALSCVRNEEGITGSFGVRKKQNESILSVDRLIQAYELCLHYTNSKDHNVVAAALETLSQILQNPPHQLEAIFLSPAGFSRSYIHSAKENKLWSRSGSEMSVAFSNPPVDETLLFDESDLTSQLSVFSSEDFQSVEMNDSKKKFRENVGNSESEVKTVENPFKEKSLGEISGSQTLDVDSDTESVAASDLNIPTNFLMRVDTTDKEIEDCELNCSRSNSQDDLYSCESERVSSLENFIDVGSFTDASVPLIYCARHLAASFLLDGAPNGLKNDRTVRVSIKSLTLSCLSAIVKLYPVVMRMNLTKNQTEFCIQEMSDVLLFSNHSDPQIRGCVCMLVGCFINSALIESKHFHSNWLNSDDSKLNSINLVSIILKGLQDKSSVCTRQALSGFKVCINRALFSVYNTHFLTVLEYLPTLTLNSYWLVKVKLVEVLSELPYVCIYDLTKSLEYEEEIVDSVLLVLLGDEDSRVRLAAAEALVKIVTFLYTGKSVVLEYGKAFMDHLNDWLKLKNDFMSNQIASLPFPLSFVFKNKVFKENVEPSLSLIISKLTCSLLVPKNKYFLFGYLEALRLLSENYPTTVYSKAWCCDKAESIEEGLISNLITNVLSLLLASPFGLDLPTFSSATVLLGNLFAGHSIANLKENYEASVSRFAGEPINLWDVFKNKRVSQLAEEILTHLLKVLNFYSHLIEEVPLNSAAAESSSAATAFLPLLSPIKRPERKSEEKTEDKKTKGANNFKQSNHYAKLQQILKNAYTNYKVSLDVSVGNKFLDFLQSTLYALSLILEVATVRETERCAEEILSYLRSVVILRPKPAIICVLQLLRSLFSANLASSWEEKKFSVLNIQDVNLFEIFFHLPTEFLSDKIRRQVNGNSSECESLAAQSRKWDRKIVIINSNKTCLATYIRLFEPMVVKSLQLYTITGDVELQSNVLRLLNQLIQLRVNYCVLDGKQVFLDFVLKQFELIEHGQIPGVEVLLPQIFKFFILLSYEKQHSKPIMSIPKILQLCDGLMASDQSVQTHCIPALVPVVEDVFLSRSLISSAEEKELETQREVLLSMLLRLVEFPEVMNLLSLVLSESKIVEEKERWKRWSRQVIDTLLPLLAQDRLRIESSDGQAALSKLMSSLSPNVLRPINPLLKALFVEPADHNCLTSLKLWLSKVTVLLEMVLFVKEDAFLNRLEETHPNINLTTFLPTGTLALTDPFNVKSFFQRFEPSETVARFLLKVLSIAAIKIDESSSSILLFEQKLSVFFVCIHYILKSGTFHRITKSLENVVLKEQASLSRVCCAFQRLRHVCPLLTCQFSYFLTLLNFCDESYWTEIIAKPCTLAGKLVQSAGVISLCDYLCDSPSDSETLHFLLKNSLEELIIFSREIPVKELLVTMRKRKFDWALLLETLLISDFESRQPHFLEKLLRLLELTESYHSGALLKLIVEKFLESPRLALSLLAGSIACRQVEYLLTLPKEKAICQIDRQTFSYLINVFKKEKLLKRHSTLWGLLNRLGTQVFNANVNEVDAERVKCQLGEEWYFVQVKQRCCQGGDPGDEIPLLLSQLTSSEKILQIMSCPRFNLKILKNCFSHLPSSSQIQENENESDKSENSLYKASKEFLFFKVEEIRKESQKAPGELHTLCLSHGFVERFWEVAGCLTMFLDFVYSYRLELGSEWAEGIADFMVLCFEVLEWSVLEKKLIPRYFEIGLKCCSTVIKSREVTNLHLTKESLWKCVCNLFQIFSNLIPRFRLSRILREKDLSSDPSEKLKVLLDFIMTEASDGMLPNYLLDCLRDLVVNLCRMPALNSDILKVPEESDMQDIDLLKSFIARFSVVGWSSRQQFEEIWVALLSVLGFNTQGDVSIEENGSLVQASAVAVEGITTLLKSTMMDSRTRKLIHHGRDSLSMKDVFDKLPVVKNVYRNDEFSGRTYQFVDNLEILQKDDRYSHGLLSVEYLWTAVKQISSQVDVHERHCEELNKMGLDLPSCIHLLTELYNQWIYQDSPDIKIVTASLKSSIVISDMFTDISQFQWLLNFCLRIDEVVIPEDTVILPLIILGSCKAAAIVLPNEEVCEKIKKLMLRSMSLPCRVSVIEGLLYLLQSYIVCYAINHTALPPPGSTFRTDEANFVANIVDAFLPLALDVVQEFRHRQHPTADEFERCHWSLVFYLLQHYHSSLGDSKDDILNFIVSTLCCKNCPESILSLLIRGTERILLTTMLNENFRDQLSKVSLELISNDSFAIARNGLQLLSVLSFLDKRVKDIRQLVTGQEDPERVMRDMEKINVLFEKLKKSYPKEAEVVGDVISYVLMDFTASDVLSKVIQEFLSSHQPHQKILAGLLFKVFERAEQSLLEDWVVFSLPSFIQGLPISMSIWTLNCFFVSASEEPWLRSLFPLVQSRIRMAEAEDKMLLCLSASQFYKQLRQESQRKSFVETFEKGAAIDNVFLDLLSGLFQASEQV